MIEIDYKSDYYGFDISIKGHAGFAKEGKDIVCAGVSILIQTLVARVKEVTVSYQINYDRKQIRHIEASGREAADIFRTILVGLKLLADHYPEYITLGRL